MENLITSTQNTLLQEQELAWIEEIEKYPHLKSLYKNPSASFYTSMIYGFAKHLPYSMDIEQKEYVPADFLNMMPYDVEINDWFKFNDRRTFYKSLINWGDTFKTGMILQICYIFQKMILGEFPPDFELNEKNYDDWVIFSMTNDEEYNKNFFEVLKFLPEYLKKVVESSNNEERRITLNKMYADLMKRIAACYGSVRRESENIIEISEGTIPINPSSDVEMRVYWDNINFTDGIPSVIQKIKEAQLITYRSRKNNLKLEKGISFRKKY